jgi:hypothetical protein
MTASLFKALKPWTGSRAQIQQTIRGAVKKKKDKEVFKNAWTINLEPGNGLQRALPLAKPNKHFGNTTFFINFQPYFMVRLSDVGLRCTCRESSFRFSQDFRVHYDEEYYLFDFQDAVTQTFVYLTTLSVGTAFVASLGKTLGTTWASALTVARELRAGNFQAACAGADAAAGGVGKVHGGAASHGNAASAAHTSVTAGGRV